MTFSNQESLRTIVMAITHCIQTVLFLTLIESYICDSARYFIVRSTSLLFQCLSILQADEYSTLPDIWSISWSVIDLLRHGCLHSRKVSIIQRAISTAMLINLVIYVCLLRIGCRQFHFLQALPAQHNIAALHACMPSFFSQYCQVKQSVQNGSCG